MTGTSGDGETLQHGTMVHLAKLWTETGRKYCGSVIDDDEWMLHILDNHKSHLDDVAIELLNNKKHFVQTLPKNTTHFLQVSKEPPRARDFALNVWSTNVVLVFRFFVFSSPSF